MPHDSNARIIISLAPRWKDKGGSLLYASTPARPQGVALTLASGAPVPLDHAAMFAPALHGRGAERADLDGLGTRRRGSAGHGQLPPGPPRGSSFGAAPRRRARGGRPPPCSVASDIGSQDGSRPAVSRYASQWSNGARMARPQRCADVGRQARTSDSRRPNTQATSGAEHGVAGWAYSRARSASRR